MADAARSEPRRRRRRREPRPARAKLSLRQTWARLDFEQRVAGLAAVLLIVSTLGPFSFVEGAIVLIGASILLLLRRRAEGREFHMPFGDGAVIAAAGTWAGLLIVLRLFSRPLGQGLLALVCAGVLVLAGLRERAQRPADDLPERRDAAEPPAPRDSDGPRAAGVDPGARPRPATAAGAEPRTEAPPDRSAYRDETLPLRGDESDAATTGVEPDAATTGVEPDAPTPRLEPDAPTPGVEPEARPRPAKVLPRPPREEDLGQPPLWDDPPRR
jgi:hypothetical protein